MINEAQREIADSGHDKPPFGVRGFVQLPFMLTEGYDGTYDGLHGSVTE